MKSKANTVRFEAHDEEYEEELKALLDLIRKQAEIDKKLRALAVAVAAATGE